MKTMMPEPMAAVIQGQIVRSARANLEEGDTLILTNQAEAYADAKVRKALEEAAIACETHPDGMNMLGGAFVTCATTIRALIK